MTNESVWREKLKPHLREWLLEEIKRGHREESIALMTRMIDRSPADPDYAYARGEIYRLRAAQNDLEAAVADYERAARIGSEPPETHRGLGLIYRLRKQDADAKASFERYLKLAPDAPDSLLIKSYMEESVT